MDVGAGKAVEWLAISTLFRIHKGGVRVCKAGAL